MAIRNGSFTLSNTDYLTLITESNARIKEVKSKYLFTGVTIIEHDGSYFSIIQYKWN